MTNSTLDPQMRRVLNAPRGRRFNRPHTSSTSPASAAAAARAATNAGFTPLARRATARPTTSPTSTHASSPALSSVSSLASASATWGHTPHEQVVLAQMRGNPRIEHRLRHGQLPAWMLAAAQRQAEHGTKPPPHREPLEPAPIPPLLPAPRPAPDEDPTLDLQPPQRTRPSRPPLPRRPRRPANHRKPRRRVGWKLTGYALAATVGAIGHHLSGLLG